MNKKLSIALLIVGSLLIVFLCIVVFIQPAIFTGLDLTETGQIGDTIGGIATPIVGILGAVLVYLSFKEQLEANRIQRLALNGEITRANNAKDMDIFLRLFEKVSGYIDNFIHNGDMGATAIEGFSRDFEQRDFKDGYPPDVDSSLKYFNHIAAQFYAIAIKLENSQFCKEDEQLALQLFLYLYIQSIIQPLNRVIGAFEDKEYLPPPPSVHLNLRRRMTGLLDVAHSKEIVL